MEPLGLLLAVLGLILYGICVGGTMAAIHMAYEGLCLRNIPISRRTRVPGEIPKTVEGRWAFAGGIVFAISGGAMTAFLVWLLVAVALSFIQ